MESTLINITLDKVYDELRNVLGAEYALIRNAPNELEKLKRLRMVISNVHQDASNQDLSQQNALSDWLDEMKDAAYDAEDIIDTFNTEILRRKSNRTSNNHRIARFIYRVNDFFSCTTNPLIFRHKIGSSVQKTLCRLTDIANEKKYHLALIGRDGANRNSVRETDSTINGDDVMGRSNDLDTIIELLFKEETNKNVLVLTGIGGIGKTTLAKLVYNDSRVDAEFGERKLWVCVSEIFDLPRILRLIIEQIDGTPCQLEGKQALTKKLIDLLEGKMYLLVLDDVWANASLTTDSWSNLKSLFRNCKILVTTREEKVTNVVSESYMHHVESLSEDDCWLLFKKMAFLNDNIQEQFIEIGKKIAKKCKGVPLALRVVSSMMRANQDYFYWLEIEESNILDTCENEEDGEIFQILKLSYNHLPLESRFCFVYCSIFPKDSVLKKKDLLQQWTGNGFIFPNEANKIFMNLLSRSFFQDVEKDDFGDITTFKMHDLIHDLAQKIAMCQCGILNNSNEVGFLSNRNNIRYLSIEMGIKYYSDISIQMKEAQKLRTLQAFSPPIMNHQFLVDCFSTLKFLRVLICSGAFNIKEVPSSIDNLKLLRYVDFSDTYIEQLPETVCNLQNLQTLKLNYCFRLKALPKKLWKLSELRHLENEVRVNVDLNLESMPIEMNKLSLLQTLSTFIVNDDGENLNELRYLNHLSGSILLEKLDNTEGVSYKKEILKEKKNLKSLVLMSGKIWDTTGQVLEALEPHPSLKSLVISQFGGSVFPTWVSDPSLHLVKVSLLACLNCTRLPPFEHLQNLKFLELCKLPLVKGKDEVNGGSVTEVLFPLLEQLYLSRMDEFRGWPEISINMPKLRTLKIKYCPKLKHMPHIQTTLCHLVLRNCDNALLLKLFETHDLPSSLSTLKIRSISNLTHITDDYFENLTALRKLIITLCHNLVSFSKTAMKHLSSLQHLEISHCQKLESLSNMEHLSSLQHLEISFCGNLESLPNMKYLSSLQHLEISCCKRLESLPNMKHLSSLQHLKISSCNNLESLPNMRHLSSLQHLKISYCDNLKSFKVCKCSKSNCVSINPDCLPSLEKLKIKNCRNLVSLPVGLKERMGDALIIKDCPGLVSLTIREEEHLQMFESGGHRYDISSASD